MIAKYLVPIFFVAALISACNSNNNLTGPAKETISTPVNVPEPSEIIKSSKPEIKSKEITEIDLSPYFGSLTGTAVFLQEGGKYISYNKNWIDERFSPNSSFHIVSSLAALESETITPTDSVFKWDGTNWPFESWNRDMNLIEAFQNSSTWYFKLLIEKTGQEYMGGFINKIGYGNCDISEWDGSTINSPSWINGFWMESSLLISPMEQLDLVMRIFEGQTDINENNILELKKMMHIETLNSRYNLYGKTGTGNGGWFVGFFNIGGGNIYFATYLTAQEGADGPKAQEITKNIIENYFLLNIT
ncbi:MAG: serine hydrolase [Clostridiales bacterium]|jgi:bla regulator protein BlaR1|nr:serine hydrolase [Clostridiales bacterium]